MNEESTIAPVPVLPARKCDPELLLGVTLVSLLRLNPTSPVLRAEVMARCKQGVPDNFQTAEVILEWVALNISPSVLPPPPGKRTLTAHRELEVEVTASETEYGRCRYSVSRSGSGTFTKTLEELRSLAEEVDDFDGLLKRLREEIENDASEIVDGMDDYGDHEYEDYESSDSENFSPAITRLKATVENYLQDADPGLLAQLNGEESDEDQDHE